MPRRSLNQHNSSKHCNLYINYIDHAKGKRG